VHSEHCTYVETQNPDENMEAQIVAMYYGMSVDHNQKNLHYIQIVAARKHPTIA